MSTDTPTAPLVPARQGYAFFEHHNSNRSRRRGHKGPTIQVVKHPEGGPLPHKPLLLKRNKYVPHVGKKQLAKAGNW
jgi:hypothetical protein